MSISNSPEDNIEYTIPHLLLLHRNLTSFEVRIFNLAANLGITFSFGSSTTMEIKTVIALFFCALAQHRCQAVLPELRDVHKRFEFLQSFKGPYLIDSQGNIPYWNHGGSKINNLLLV